MKLSGGDIKLLTNLKYKIDNDVVIVEEMRKIMKLRRHGKSSALGFAGFKLKRLAVGSACNSI